MVDLVKYNMQVGIMFLMRKFNSLIFLVRTESLSLNRKFYKSAHTYTYFQDKGTFLKQNRQQIKFYERKNIFILKILSKKHFIKM